MPHVKANFSSPPAADWQCWVLPGSRIETTDSTWRFINAPRNEGYTDAQIDDYQGLRRRAFKWTPPVTLRVRARFSHPAGALNGTAGFGFWNDPFMMTGARPPALPRAIWFFYASPHSNMKLDLHTPGHGWKAATIDARRWSFYALAPTAPLAIPLMHIKPLYRALWPLGQRAIAVSEAAIDTGMTAWHTYELHWGKTGATFNVDNEPVLTCPTPPRGPLGFVLWIDNQALTVTPWGRFGWRTVALTEEQWLEIDTLEITSNVELK